MKEREKIKQIQRDLPAYKRLFRINSGMGYSGTVARREGSFLYLKNARPFHAGFKGCSDLLGFTSIEVTADMVGQRLAVFTAEEVKLSGKLSKEQKLFLDMVKRMGGFTMVHRK